MRIREVAIHNFRSVADLTLLCGSLVALIGPNNAGKSNIIGALEFALTPGSKPTDEDFFAFRSEDLLWVELEFVDLTEQEKRTFSRYVTASGVLRFRKAARLIDGTKVETEYHGYTTEPTAWWLKADAWPRLNTKDLVTAAAQEIADLAPLADKTGRLAKQDLLDLQQGYIEAHCDDLEFETDLENGPFLGAANVAGGILPDFFLVPAVRELVDETKTKGTSLLSRLLQRIVTDVAVREGSLDAAEEQLRLAIAALNVRGGGEGSGERGLPGLEAALEHELSRWGVRVSIRVDPPSIDRIFELGTRVLIDDGYETAAERKGHGLQRALVFALLRTWAEANKASPDGEDVEPLPRKASASVVFAVEEPELYLHPHAQRQLYEVLKQLSDSPERQVILCTHSPAFVDIEHYQGLGIACKENPKVGTSMKQCSCDLFGAGDADAKKRFQMAGWLNPARGELFFARRVILVEGETEERVLPVLAKRLGCWDPEVSVIDCGSKNNLVSYIGLLNQFRIPYLVVHDEDPVPDPVPDDWKEDRAKQARRTYAENARIASFVDHSLGSVEVLSPCFEEAAGVSKSQGEKVGKAMAAMESLADRDVPVCLQAIVRLAFASPKAGVEGQGRDAAVSA